MPSRFIWVLMISLGALLVAGCNRFTDDQLVGTWRSENDEAIDEIALQRDHSFRKLLTSKNEFTIPSPIEETGTWRVARNQLKLDSIVTWSKKRSQHKLQLLQVTKDTLRMKNIEEGRPFTCVRLDEANCANLSALTAQHPLPEESLIGIWQIHFHTHDYQFTFEKDHLFSISASISGNREPITQGIWRVVGNDLITHDKSSHDTKGTETKWTLTGMGTDCLTVKDAESWSYVLKRLK